MMSFRCRGIGITGIELLNLADEDYSLGAVDYFHYRSLLW